MSLTTAPETKDFAHFLDRANALLAGRSIPQDGDEILNEQRDQIRMAEPGVYLAHVLEFFSHLDARYFPDLDERKIADAFCDALTRHNFSYGNLHLQEERNQGARAVEEFSVNLLRLAAGTYFSNSDCMHSQIRRHRENLDVEAYKNVLLPMFRAINKALAARTGAKLHQDGNRIAEQINNRLSLSPNNYPQEVSTDAYIRDLLKQYREGKVYEMPGENKEAKKDVVVPRLEKIAEKISYLDKSFAKARFFLPPLMHGDNRLISYDIEVQLDLIEDQIQYFEEYFKNKGQVDERKRKDEEESKRTVERQTAGKLVDAEKAVAELASAINKLQGDEEGGIDAMRTRAGQLEAFLKITKEGINSVFEEIKEIKLSLWKKNMTYLQEVKALLDMVARRVSEEGFEHALKTKKIKVESHEWKQQFQPRDFPLPADTSKGDERLRDFKALESHMKNHKSQKLDHAYQEAVKRLETLKKDLSFLASELARMNDGIGSLSPETKGNILAKSVHAQLNTLIL